MQFYLSGNIEKKYTETTPSAPTPVKSLDEIVNYIKPEVESAPEIKSLDELVNYTDISDKTENIVVASSIIANPNMCHNVNNLDQNSDFAKTLNSLKTCVLSDLETLSADRKITRSEALSAIMRYYGENPDFGTSPFLDIPLGDTKTQGWALRAFNKNIFAGEYLRPYDTLTRAEFIEILGRFGGLKAAPSDYIAYTDISRNSTLYKNLQNFGYTIGVKNAKFYPNRAITEYEVVKFLSYLP